MDSEFSPLTMPQFPSLKRGRQEHLCPRSDGRISMSHREVPVTVGGTDRHRRLMVDTWHSGSFLPQI